MSRLEIGGGNFNVGLRYLDEEARRRAQMLQEMEFNSRQDQVRNELALRQQQMRMAAAQREQDDALGWARLRQTDRFHMDEQARAAQARADALERYGKEDAFREKDFGLKQNDYKWRAEDRDEDRKIRAESLANMRSDRAERAEDRSLNYQRMVAKDKQDAEDRARALERMTKEDALREQNRLRDDKDREITMARQQKEFEALEEARRNARDDRQQAGQDRKDRQAELDRNKRISQLVDKAKLLGPEALEAELEAGVKSGAIDQEAANSIKSQNPTLATIYDTRETLARMDPDQKVAYINERLDRINQMEQRYYAASKTGRMDDPLALQYDSMLKAGLRPESVKRALLTELNLAVGSGGAFRPGVNQGSLDRARALQNIAVQGTERRDRALESLGDASGVY